MNSDIINNFNFLENVIFERLNEWNMGAEGIDAEGKLLHWLPSNHSDAFVSLYRDFYKLQKASINNSLYKVQKHSSYELHDRLDGWECGLYQVLDISREDICKALPILLTAYCYNYARGISFVQNFLQAGIPNSWKSQNPFKPNLYYIGAEFDEEFQGTDAEDDDRSAETQSGIDKLLCGYERTDKQILGKYAKSFFFEKLEIVPTFAHLNKTTKIIDAEYIIPSRGKSVFLKSVHRRPWKNESEERVKWEIYRGERFEFVVDELCELGLTWMLTVYMVASNNIKVAEGRNEKPDFACEPDLYSCYRYLASVLNNGIVPETKYDCLKENRRNAAIVRDLKNELHFRVWWPFPR